MSTDRPKPYHPPSDGLRCPYRLARGKSLTFISTVPGVVLLDMDDASASVWELPPCQPVEIDDPDAPDGKRLLYVACFLQQDDEELEAPDNVTLRSVGFRSEMLMSGPYDVEWFGVRLGIHYGVTPCTHKDTTLSRHVTFLM